MLEIFLMNEMVYKFEIPIQNFYELELSKNGSVLHFAEQHGIPCIWVRLDPKEEHVVWRFHLRGIGHPLPEGRALQHVGTCLCNGGELVWHLFRDRGPVGIFNEKNHPPWYNPV